MENSAMNTKDCDSINSFLTVENKKHLKYLNDFRVKQCERFKNKWCDKHKPFTCFDWHFPNQRRRKLVRNNDGSFNYIAKLCQNIEKSKCPDGDACYYSHNRTEQLYHYETYKVNDCNTNPCNNEHCAFAHELNDKRNRTKPPSIPLIDSSIISSNPRTPIERSNETGEITVESSIENSGKESSQLTTESIKKIEISEKKSIDNYLTEEKVEAENSSKSTITNIDEVADRKRSEEKKEIKSLILKDLSSSSDDEPQNKNKRKTFTNERLNAAKFSTIVVEIARKICATNLKAYIKDLGYDTKGLNYLNEFFEDYFHLVYVNKDIFHYSIIYKKLVNKNGDRRTFEDLDTFDISLMYSIYLNLILNKTEVELSKEKKDAKESFLNKPNDSETLMWEKIKEHRNRISHWAEFSLSDYQYGQLISEIKHQLIELCKSNRQKKAVASLIDDIMKEKVRIEDKFENEIYLSLVTELRDMKSYFEMWKDETMQQNSNEKQNLINEYKTIVKNIKNFYKDSIEKSNEIKEYLQFYHEKLYSKLEDESKAIKEAVSNSQKAVIDHIDKTKRSKTNETFRNINSVDITGLYDAIKEDRFNFNILVLSRLNEDNRHRNELADTLSNFHWDIIFDLDPKCENESGLKRYVVRKIEESGCEVFDRLVKELSDSSRIESERICYYVFVNGSEARCELAKLDEIEFLFYIKQFMEKIFTKYNKSFRVHSFFFSDYFQDDIMTIGSINKAILTAHSNVKCQNSLEVINLVSSEKPKEIESDANYVQIFSKLVSGFKTHSTAIENLYEIIARLKNAVPKLTKRARVEMLLPKDTQDWVLEPNEHLKYEEIIEVYHKGIGYDPDADNEVINKNVAIFLKGNSFDPKLVFYRQNFNNCFTYVLRDIIREDSEFLKKIENRMKGSFLKKYYILYTLYYEPSSGASTIVRLFMYYFKDKMPCMRIKSLKKPDLLIDAIDYISIRSGTLPVFLIIDDPQRSSMSNFDEVEALISKLEDKKIKTIILCTERVLKADKYKERENSFILEGKPSEREKADFDMLYKHYFPNETDGKDLKEPDSIFYFGLFYLAEKYNKIESFVKSHSEEIKKDEAIKKLFFIICIYYKYTHQLFSLQVIAHLITIMSGERLEPGLLEKFFVIGDLSCLNEKHKASVELLNRFFAFDENNEKIGLRPLNARLGDYVIENIKLNIKKNDVYSYSIDCFLSFIDLIGKASHAYNKDLYDMGECLFIIKNVHERYNKDKSSEEINQEVFFSSFILEASAELTNDEFKQKLTLLQKTCCDKKSKEFESLGLRVGAVLARFISFNFTNTNRRSEAVELMKDILGIKKNIKDVQDLRYFRGYPNNSDLIATYGNLIRHKLAHLYEEFKKSDFACMTTDKEEELYSLAEESIDACTKAYQIYQDNPIAYHCEILARQKIMTFYFKYFCKSNKETFTANVENKLCRPIIYQSERIIIKKCEYLKYLVQINLYQERHHEKSIFNVCEEIYNFRLDYKDSLIDHLQKFPNATIDVFNYCRAKKAKDRNSNVDKSKKRDIMWSDFDEKELKEIIKACEIKLNNNATSSNFRDLIIAYTQIQNPEYNLDNAILRVEQWLDWLKSKIDKKKTKKPKGSVEDFVPKNIRNDMNFANYLNAVFAFIKSIKTNESTEINKYLPIAYEFFKPENSKNQYAFNKKDNSFITQFYVSNDDGLMCLKPRNRFELSENKPSENKSDDEDKKIVTSNKSKNYLEESSLRKFRGALKAISNQGWTTYYAKISETMQNNQDPLTANYTQRIAKTQIPPNEYSNKIYEFAVLIRPDKIYMILPKKA